MSIVNIIPADVSACGYYRLIQVANILSLDKTMDVTLSPMGKYRFYGQQYNVTQRIVSESIFQQLMKFKERTNTKFIVDYDDLLWEYKGESIPEYNATRTMIDMKGNTEAMKKYLNDFADKVIVSTEYLKNALEGLVDVNKIVVIPNMLNRKEWHFDRVTSYRGDSIFYYAGSPTHYNNVKHLSGDFSNAWVDYLQDKPTIIQGVVPYFIKPIATQGWSPLNSYAHDFYVGTRQCQFIIAPLANNIFNRCKSDLKYLEACAVGRVCLMSEFEDGPYNGAHPYQLIPSHATKKQIEYCIERAKENYTEILNYQYEYLNNRWLDNNIGMYHALFKDRVEI